MASYLRVCGCGAILLKATLLTIIIKKHTGVSACNIGA